MAASISIQPVIMAGGSGTRLWPLSRAGFPKQFLSLGGDDSLFQQAVGAPDGPGGGRHRRRGAADRRQRRTPLPGAGAAAREGRRPGRRDPRAGRPQHRAGADAGRAGGARGRRRSGAGGVAGRPDRHRPGRLHRGAAAGRARRRRRRHRDPGHHAHQPRDGLRLHPQHRGRGPAQGGAVRREARRRDRRALPGRGRLHLELRHVRAARLGVAEGARAVPPRHPRRHAGRLERPHARRALHPPDARGLPGRAVGVGRLRRDGALPRQRVRHPHGAAGRRLERPRRLGRGLAGRRQGRRGQLAASAT